MKKNQFPKDWDENRVKKVIAHYENQTEDEALSDEKIECQRVYGASGLLDALRYGSYVIDMGDEEPNDARSAVLINAKRPSGKAI